VSELMVEYLGYTAAFLGCGVIGTASAMLLWWGLPERNKQVSDHGSGLKTNERTQTSVRATAATPMVLGGAEQGVDDARKFREQAAAVSG
jgi:hypothetical protein